MPPLAPLIILSIFLQKPKGRSGQPNGLGRCTHKSPGRFCYTHDHNIRDPQGLYRGPRPPAQTLSEQPLPPPAPGVHRHPRGGQGAHRQVEPRALSSFHPSCTFLHGLEDTSNEALNALLCWVVKMVLGRLGRLWSLPSSALPFPVPWADLQILSSSSLLPKSSRKQ